MDENEFKKLWKEVLKVFSDNKLNVNSISSLKTDVLISPKQIEKLFTIVFQVQSYLVDALEASRSNSTWHGSSDLKDLIEALRRSPTWQVFFRFQGCY